MVMNAFKNRIAALGGATRLRFRAVYPDGSTYQNRPGEAEATLIFRSPAVAWRMLLNGHVGLLEAYFAQELDVEGDFARVFRLGFDSGLVQAAPLAVRLRNRWHEWRFSNHAAAQAKKNAGFHYDLPNAFYRRWLDPELMSYTCAYWKEGTANLEEAQRNKVEHACRKIRLAPGETVADVGCGFGGFLYHAAERHGARVTGINTASAQVAYVRSEIARRGIAERARVVESDFRGVGEQFDKVISIGVLEHAGRDQLDAVIKAHADLLRPGGLGMIHFIGHVGVFDTDFFIRKYLFPGGWIPSLAQVLVALENCGLEVIDVENLRRHYALTLDEWAARFDREWEQIRAIDPQRFDERFRRVWRTYLYGCAEMFRSPRGITHLFQIVFSKGNVDISNYPMGRAWLYEAAGASPGQEAPAALATPQREESAPLEAVASLRARPRTQRSA